MDAVEPAIRKLLLKTPDMPVTVIAERIGWQRGMTVLRDRVREIRPDYLVSRRATGARSMSQGSWVRGICGSRRWTSLSAGSKPRGCR